MAKAKQQKPRFMFLKLFLIVVLILAALFFDSNFRIDVSEYTLEYKSLPESFDGYRMAVLSDFHAAEFGEGNSRLISAIERAKPDVILIIGDFIDSDGQLDIARTLLRGIRDLAPIYYITGNHEWDSGVIGELFKTLKEEGVTALRNDYVLLERGGESIVLAGVEDPNGPSDMISPYDFIKKVQGETGGKFLVALNHRNHLLDFYSTLGVELVISGHAHGGIVRLPFTDGLIGPRREWFPEHTSGVYTEGLTKMLVSRGVGSHAGVPRFLNNPHIPVAVLKKA